MKTAEDSYKKFAGIWTPEDLFLMDYENFMQALTEHDNEIKGLIDEMEKTIDADMEKDYSYTINLPDNAFNYLIGYKKALTEFKNKLGLWYRRIFTSKTKRSSGSFFWLSRYRTDITLWQ